MEYTCDKCNKNYSSYQSLWIHNKKYHSKKETDGNGKVTDGNGKVTVYDENGKANTKFECCYCGKNFKCKQNKYEHEKKVCGSKNKNENELKKLQKENEKIQKENEKLREEFKNAINEIKKEFIDLIKNGQVLPHNLKQINNKVQKVNIKYGNHNNINNGQIINNTYVKFGTLDYTKIFSEKEICKLMTNFKYKCIEEFIKQVHFNDKHPEYGNIFITNLRDNIAYVFDGNEFMAHDKTDTMIELIDDHANEINLSLDNHRKNLNPYTITKIEDMLKKLESEEKYTDENNGKTYDSYKVYKMNTVKKDIYNLSDRKKLEMLQNIELFEKRYDEFDEEFDEFDDIDDNKSIKSITI